MIAFWDSVMQSYVSEMHTASIIKTMGLIAVMIEVVHVSETSDYFNETTRRDVPEGCHLHTPCRETLKSNNFIQLFSYD
jgi:hypothetical protein